MYISPVGYRFSTMNGNINRIPKVPIITAANKTDIVAFGGNEKNGATERDLLLSEVYPEYSPKKIINWANQYGYTTVEEDGEILVKDAKDRVVRVVNEDWNNPGKIFEDIVKVLDKDGICQKMYRRYASGTAELNYGGLDGSAWNNYAFRDKSGNWTGYGSGARESVPIKNPLAYLLEEK